MSTSGNSKQAGKQVIYVDVDDEITTVIDKMNTSDSKVVALVLPKRATVFQSIVNMKLLKRRAENSKKHIVLITSESGLMPLAGLAGVHVAPTLQSKPEVPPAGIDHGAAIDDDEESASLSDDFDPSANGKAPIGALAGVADDNEVIQLDNTTKKPSVLPPAASPALGSTAAKPKKDRKLSVPNFFSFRKRLVLIGLAILLLIGGWYVAFFVMPKATVTIVTNSSDIEARMSLTLDTAARSVDAEKLILPSETKQEQKSSTGQAPATGQENRGAKAGGSIKLSMADCSQNSVTVPAGTGLSTSDGLVFITQASATLSSIQVGGTCRNNDFPAISTQSVTVEAQKGGANYNVQPTTFKSAPSGVNATSSDAMTGGTDQIVKIVQQSDIDAAKQKVAAGQDQDSIKKQLQSRLEDDNLYVLAATFNAGAPNENISVKAGDEAENVTVTQAVTYTMFGVKKDDLKKIIDTKLKAEIKSAEQSILDDGLDSARISVGTPGAGPQLKADVFVTGTVGPKIDIDSIKTAIVGMKSGNVKDRIKQTDGVEDVKVKYSPFWITKAPKADKITVEFEKSAAESTSSSNGE